MYLLYVLKKKEDFYVKFQLEFWKNYCICSKLIQYLFLLAQK